MDFLSLIEDHSQLNYETLGELRKMVEQYPFFHQARLLYLVNLHQLRDPSFDDELRRGSVFLPSPSALFHLVEGQHYDIENTSVKSPIMTEDEDRTLSLIDNFLTQQPEEEKEEESEPHSVPTVAEVTSDYASFLAMQEEVESPVEDNPEKGGADAIIDSCFPKRMTMRLRPLHQTRILTALTFTTRKSSKFWSNSGNMRRLSKYYGRFV